MQDKKQVKKIEKTDLKHIRKELEECQKEANEYLAGWQRAKADLLNYKKEEAKRILNILEYAKEELILKILPILDNFEKAEKEVPEKLKKENYLKGIFQIKSQLEDFLDKEGVEEIKSLGEDFNPKFHEAVQVEKTESNCPEKIIEVIQKGYKIKGKVVRAAKVKVSK